MVRPYKNGPEFHRKLEVSRQENKFGCCVDNHPPEELEKMKMFMSDDGLSGVAVERDGNICCAFSSNHRVRMVDTLLDTAKKNGGTKMDCYGKKLVNMYEGNGFRPVARIPFNEEYVEKTEFNKPLLENRFDVYVMTIDEGNSHMSSQQELDNLPTFEDYDEALSYRDRILEKERLKNYAKKVKR